MNKRLAASVGLAVWAAASGALAATPEAIDQARAAAVAWLVSHQAGDGRWIGVGGADVQATASALLGLDAAGITRGYPRAAGLNWLANAHAGSVDALARQAAALGRLGFDAGPQFADLDAARSGLRKAWGAYPGYGVSLPDTPVALEAYRVASVTYADASASLGILVNAPAAGGARNSDGGWPYVVDLGATGLAPTPSRFIPTAAAVLALARWREPPISYAVDAQITGGVNWLLARGKPDSGYADDPAATSGSAFETALFLRALRAARAVSNSAALAATAQHDAAVDFLVARQAADGSWQGDPLTTAFGLHGLPGGALPDGDADGVPDASETILGTNPAIVDTKYLAGSSSHAELGTHHAAPLGGAEIGVGVSLQLPVPSGTVTSYGLAAGILPDGLSLDPATGVISGSAATVGTFSFIYTAFLSDGSTVTRAAAIDVVAPTTNTGDDVPTLTQWAQIVLGALLLASLWRTQRPAGARRSARFG